MSIYAIPTETYLLQFEEVKKYFYKYILSTYYVVDSVPDALNPEKIKTALPHKDLQIHFHSSIQSTKYVLLMISHVQKLLLIKYHKIQIFTIRKV